MHDRYVNDSQLDSNLPGHNGNVTTTRSFVTSGNQSSSYQIVDESTSNLLKYGPGGIVVDDTSSFGSDTAGDHSGNTWQGTFNIGGGNGTNHGYMTNLDSDVLGLATNETTTQYVDAVWEYGSGAVYYSTTPLDYYIGSGHVDNDAWDAYALNSLHYATSLIFDGYSQINGTSSAESIYGTAGDDVIFGDYGSDILWGGQGADTFLYTNSNQGSGTIDDIQDFDKDEDSIDISAITSGASVSRTLTNNTQFKLDIDNNGTYDMQFNLVGYTGTADDVTVVT
jgi:Ca2+-binding RTX toxin-like protein